MKKLIIFLLIIPHLINAQSFSGDVYNRQRPLRISDAVDTIGIFDKSDHRQRLIVQLDSYTINAVIVEKIAIGNTPAVIYKPSDFDPSKKYPVWVFFHGLSEMAKDKPELDRLIVNGNHAALLSAAEKYKFIVVAPQLVQAYNSWVPGWTNHYVNPILEYVVNNTFTDQSHIVATGLSLGGGGTWVAATSAFAQYLSAVIPICATPQYDQDFSQIAKYNTPVWAFVAKDDVAYHTAQVNTINSINKFSPSPAPISTIYNSGGHAIWGAVYSDTKVYEWALAQSNNAPIIIPPPPAPVDEIIGTYKIVVYKSGKIEIIKQ